MNSLAKLLAILLVVFALSFYYVAATNDDDDSWDDDANAAMTDNDDTALLFNSFLMKRKLANSFIDDDQEDEMYKRLFGSSSKDKTTTAATTTTKKPKHDPEEIREIEAKANARRRKAYKNYEDACKVNGKFTVRTCPKIEDCFARNKVKFIPVVDPKVTPAATTTITTTTRTTYRPGRRELIDRDEAMDFFQRDMNDAFDDDDDDDDDDLSLFKRMLFGKNASKELIEETKERKTKAFKKYEEYCEKRKFRIGAQRNCPPLKAELC